MSEAVSVAFGTELQDMPVLGPGEFPPPKILDAGQYKVTVSKARLLDKQDYKTVLIAMEELDQRVIPITIRRVNPNGDFQNIPLFNFK